MFGIPGSMGGRARNESILQTLSDWELVEHWGSSNAPDIITAGVACLRTRIARLAKYVQSGSVMVRDRLNPGLLGRDSKGWASHLIVDSKRVQDYSSSVHGSKGMHRMPAVSRRTQCAVSQDQWASVGGASG